MHAFAAFAFSLLAALSASEARAQTPEAQDPLTLRPYLFKARDGQEIEAQWGVLKVPEERGNPATRTLHLAFVRLPSLAPEPGPPIVYLAGGPGSSGIEIAKGARMPLLRALREIADVILLDQRGTGSSRPTLVCRDSWAFPYDEPLDPVVVRETITEKTRTCAETLEKNGTVLSAYNALEIADDVEDLRRALGASRISLVATSYGTHLALATIRRHEASIHRAVLMGVVGPDQAIKLPQRIQRRLEEIGGTHADASGPALAEAVETVLERLEQPVTVTARDLLAGKDVELTVGRFDLQLATIRALGSSRSLGKLQAAYTKLLAGDFTPLASDFLAVRKQWLGQVMPYSVVCASGISPERWQEVVEQEKDAVLGRWLDFPFPEICSSLSVQEVGSELRSRVRSRLPVLLVSGTLDVRTPVENAEEVLKGFPNGRHLVVEGAGHGDDLMVASPEIEATVVDFLHGRAVETKRIAAAPLWERVPSPPPAQVKNVVESFHGEDVSDPYRWLEEPKTPETKMWVNAQNRYADDLLHVLPGRRRLERQIEQLLGFDTASRPWVRGRRTFYSQRRADQELASILVRDGEEEQVLVDPPSPAESVRIMDVSADGELLAYGVQEGGRDEIEVVLFDVEKRRPLADRLPRSRYFDVSILPGGRGVYYSREKAPGQGGRVYFHRLGTDPASDREIFGEGYGSGTIVWGNLSDDGRYLVAHALSVSGASQKVEMFVQNVETGGEMLEVVNGVDATFYGGVLGDTLVIHTDWQAPRGRVMVADPDDPDRAHWRELVPEREKAVIRTVFGAGGRLFVEYLEDVQSKLIMFDLEGRELGEVPFPAIGTLGGMRGLWHQKEVYFSFSSFHVPPTVYRFEVETGKLAVWKRAEVPIEADRFEIRQVWYPSKDGTQVPMFVIHPKGLKLDGSSPTVLRGYGGFSTSLTPVFTHEASAWIQQGGVYAIANVRGGGELGEEWHQAAVREKKQRSIDDFVAAAEWLIERGYTRPEKLAISGHSNGGLLVAAALTQRPELFRAAVCSHALLDMLRYNKFMAARFWLAEYGSADRPEFFEHLYAYSPYHRLDESKEYPAVLFITAADDTRVAPLHVRKMTARMQAQATPERPVLVRYHARAGHSLQGMPMSVLIDEATDTLSFLLWQLDEL